MKRSRRIAQFAITPEALMNLIRIPERYPDALFVGQPHVDFEREMIVLTMEDPSFAEVAEGAVIPRVEVILTHNVQPYIQPNVDADMKVEALV